MKSFLHFGLMAYLAMQPSLSLASPIAVRIYDRNTYYGSLALLVDGKQAASFNLSGSDKWSPSALIDWPVGKPISLRGEFSGKGKSWWRSPKKGEMRWETLDITSLVAPLRDGTKPLPNRVRDFLSAKRAFEDSQGKVLDGTIVSIEETAKLLPKDLLEIDEKLGFPLPREHKELLLEIGPFTVDDSLFMAANGLDNAYNQMLTQWGTPEEVLSQLDASEKEFFRSSVILFTESGDGYGGWIYNPKNIEGFPAGYYWVAQESGTDPQILKNPDGTKKDYTNALIWLLSRVCFSRYDLGGVQLVPVDHSAQFPIPYFLESDDDGGFTFRLRLDWDKFE